jgi:pimeloyl-ACP methyl ester carboxylesterase
VLDQVSPDPSLPCGSDRLQPEVSGAPRFMKVSWNASEAPPGYSSLGSDVIFVARPDGYERLTYAVQLNNEGNLCYRWQDNIFGEDLTLVVILPAGHVVRAGDTRPPAAVSKVFQGRLALCWQLRGKHQSRVWIHWKIRPAEPDQIVQRSGELNEELRHRHGSSSQAEHDSSRKKRRIAAVGLVLLLAFVAAGLLKHFVFGGSRGRHTRTAVPHYERNQRKERVIVFVHGLFGDATSTWTCPAKTYWPAMLLKDHAFDDSDIYVASYDTPYLGNRMTIDDVVANLDNRLENDHIFEHRDVVFVAHSLGGLIVQRFLLTHREYAKQVKVIYFFSTPETGAEVAKVGSIFSQDPLLREMFPGGENDYLQNLEMEWRAGDFGNIRRYCAYEMQPTNGILVVDRLSGTRNCGKVVALNENHISIVKPCSVEDDAYIALRNAVEENPAPFPTTAKWIWIDPVSPPDFAVPLEKVLTSVDSPLTALEWDHLKAEGKQELQAQWIVFGSPEYDAAAVPGKITLSGPASARMVTFILNSNGDAWHEVEETELGTSAHCQKCAGLTGKIRFTILVFPLDRSSYDLILKDKAVPERLFSSAAN